MLNHLRLATAWGEEHGLINVLTNSVPYDEFKNFKPEHKKQLEHEKKEDSRMVKAKYLNSRGRHERLEMVYCKYAGDPILQLRLIPNYVYELPMGLINQVNQKRKIKREGLVSVGDKQIQSDGSPLQRDEEDDWEHQLVPVNF